MWKHLSSSRKKGGDIGPVLWLCEKLKISEIVGLPHLEATICMVGEWDSKATKGEIKVTDHHPAHLTRSSRGTCGKLFEDANLHNTHKEGYVNAERHPTGP